MLPTIEVSAVNLTLPLHSWAVTQTRKEEPHTLGLPFFAVLSLGCRKMNWGRDFNVNQEEHPCLLR